MTVRAVTCQENTHDLEIALTLWQHRNMSVNQTTVADDESTVPGQAVPGTMPVNTLPPEPKAATKAAERTDMVGKALSLLVLLGDEPRGASAAEISRRAELRRLR